MNWSQHDASRVSASAYPSALVQSDWIELSSEADRSDADDGEWSSYPIEGHPALEIVVARHAGDDPIAVRVLAADGATDDLRVPIGAAAEIFNSYRVR